MLSLHRKRFAPERSKWYLSQVVPQIGKHVSVRMQFEFEAVSENERETK